MGDTGFLFHRHPNATDQGYEEPGVLDLDKSWHALHTLLSLQRNRVLAWAFANLEEGGEVLPERVQRIARALDGVKESDLRLVYDAHLFRELEVFPIGAWDNEEEGFRIILSYYKEFRRFYQEAADRGHAVTFELR